MKHLIALFCLMPFVALSQITDPLEYMEKISKDQDGISKDMWAYTRAASKGRNARKLDKKRQELIRTYYLAKNRVTQMPAFKKDPSYKAAMAQFYNLSQTILKREYGKIMDLEAIAEDSYDLMEAYLRTKELADLKLDSAFVNLKTAQKDFADKHNIKLIEGTSRIGNKLRRANEVNGYTNDCYLVFFKTQHQEGYMLKAMESNKVGEIEQSRLKLAEYANQGKVRLKEIGAFESDFSLAKAVDNMLNFYLSESNRIEKLMDFYFLKEDMERSNSYIQSKKQSQLTNEDIDKHNSLINKYNASVNNFNNETQVMNDLRAKNIEKYQKVNDTFDKMYMP